MEGKGKGKAKGKNRGLGPKKAHSEPPRGGPDTSPKDTAQASDQVKTKPQEGPQTVEMVTKDKISRNLSIRETTITIWAKRLDNGQWIRVDVKIDAGVRIYHDGKLFAEH